LLADYLRSHGFHVDELPRDAVITKELLQKYTKIIRVPAFYPYSDDEINAYQQFLNSKSSILLMEDHLEYTTNDKLSELLGLDFEGSVEGQITHFASSPVTDGTDNLYFNAGSVVVNTDSNTNISVLGWIDKDGYVVLNNQNPFGYGQKRDLPVMGTVNNFPNTKIFFIGDGNLIEPVPQPFTQNLINWLFQ
jgi:hypothetical protein